MSERRPILIHQMGKVGSRSVVESLKATLPEARIEHLHQLSEEGLAAVIAFHTGQGEDVPPHIEAADRVQREILRPGVGADVITMVREPVGRNMSAFFQNLPKKRKTASDEEIDALCERFLEGYAHTMPVSWFHREFDPVYAIEMLEQPFDPAVGWAEYTSGVHRILLMRCETSDEVKQEAMRSFLGLDSIEWQRVNESKNKRYAEVYRRFKERLVLPTELVDRLLDSEYSRHFYTDAELAGYRSKWLGERAPSVG